MADKSKGRYGQHRAAFEKNKARVLAAQSVCGICGKPVDNGYKYPHPLSPTVDHIIPITKGGHPSDMNNLQLAHRCCNRQKSDRLPEYRKQFEADEKENEENMKLPLCMDWKNYAPS